MEVHILAFRHCLKHLFCFTLLFCDATSRLNAEDKVSYYDIMRQLCGHGSFGYKCHLSCRCEGNKDCDKVTGSCPNGCAIGFWGPGCQLSDKCFYNGQRKTYMGRMNKTEEGLRCQAWASQYPHEHTYTINDFSEKVYPNNYCRTTHDASRPWCYAYSREKRWGYCDTDNCDCPSGLFGHNCWKTCHCQGVSDNCESNSGICKFGCEDGWSGYNCQTQTTCQVNFYGWSCENACHCENGKHCDRFTGPTETCRCQQGYVNPPACNAAISPRIIQVVSQKVNPAQPTTINCTAFGVPVPKADEITLSAPEGRRVFLNMSTTLHHRHDARHNVFWVPYVLSGENFKCIARNIAGIDMKTIVPEVFELPRLNAPHSLVDGTIAATNVTVEWIRWNPDRGDQGDPPILWYSVHVRGEDDTAFWLAGIVYHTFCGERCHYQLQNLRPNTRYRCYVSVRRDGVGGDGPAGTVIGFTTKCSAPSKPARLTQMKAGLKHNVSIPLTVIQLSWAAPSKSTIHCNHIANYVIKLLAPFNQGRPLTWQMSKSYPRTKQLNDLTPFTNYCASIYFVTDGNFQSPISDGRCITTPATVPPYPENLAFYRATSSTVTLTWSRPQPLYGDLISYHVKYEPAKSDEKNSKAKIIDWMSESSLVRCTLSGLIPSTIYDIQVRVLNTAGTSDFSAVLTVQTQEDVPGKVLNLQNISRSENYIELRWIQPQYTNGVILHYTVVCQPQKSLFGSLVQITFERHLGPQKDAVLMRDLAPATMYNCSVFASTGRGPGHNSSVTVWTEAASPRQPMSPVIISTTDTTVTLDIHHSGDLTVSFYRIIVECLKNDFHTNIHRRHIGIPSYLRKLNKTFINAIRMDLRAYVTAQLPRQTVSGSFIVGDNETYEGFLNGPLRRNMAYDMWLVAFSNVDGALRETFAKTKNPVLVRALSQPQSEAHLPITVLVSIVMFIIGMMLAILFIIVRRRRVTPSPEKKQVSDLSSVYTTKDNSLQLSTPISETAGNGFTEILPLRETNIECPPEYEQFACDSREKIDIAPIKVEDLWDFLRGKTTNEMDRLIQEYKLLPTGLTAACEVAMMSENKLKNRYGNIVAYDHSRVELDQDNDEIPTDDYINGNYIDGYNRQKSYIATQGPTQSTVKDLWRMVWQENCKTLIMLTNLVECGKSKCEDYWPNDDCEQYGPITVQLMDNDKLPDFTIRTFLLSKNGRSKFIKQFHFTTWPDHGVPRFGHSLLQFRHKIRQYDNIENGSIIIHCSAGVGRTGTYIAIDTQLDRARAEGIIDIHNFVLKMRRQRVNMVQSFEQYKFVYDSLLEALICGDTTVHRHLFRDAYRDLTSFDVEIKKAKLEEQFEVLSLLSVTIKRDQSTSALSPENILKNRSTDIIPANRCRPYLMTPLKGSNDYINAVVINTYKRKNGHVVTQMPLPETIVDFWRLIYDQHCHTIVMLNDIGSNVETCIQYWNDDHCGVMFGPFKIQTLTRIQSDCSITLRDFTLTNTNMVESPRVIRQFHFQQWSKCDVPCSSRAFLRLVACVDDWRELTGNSSVVIHCMNGASRSGIFCAVQHIMERLSKDNEVDVFQAVKHIRLNRSQFIDSMEQYIFCYEIVLHYLTNTDLSVSPPPDIGTTES